MLPMTHRCLPVVVLACALACGIPRALAAQQPGTDARQPAGRTHKPPQARGCGCADERARPRLPEPASALPNLDQLPLAGLAELDGLEALRGQMALLEPALAGSDMALLDLQSDLTGSSMALQGLEPALAGSDMALRDLQPALVGPEMALLDVQPALAGSDMALLEPGLVGESGMAPLQPGVSFPALSGKSLAFATVPPAPAPARQGQPADSVYRLARERLNQGDFGQAANLFRQIVERWPDSKWAADALYWNAFALYRRGASGDLKRALDALQEQRQRYPHAATHGDAEALSVRINGELARGGDTQAAEAIAAQAAAIETQVGKAGEQAAVAAAAIAQQDAELGKQAARLAERAARMGEGVRASFDDDRLPPQCAGQQEKQEMRIAALNALLQMDADQAVPVLRDLLKRRDECSAPLRRKAVFVISQKPNAQTEDILLDAVRNDPDPGVQGQALFWLAQVPGERSLKAIESVLSTTKDPRLQERALFALSQHHSPEAGADLRRFVTDESAPLELREKAIFMLGQVSASPENAAFLRDLYRRSGNAQLKERIIASMIGADDEASGRFLEEVALDPKASPDVRKKALFLASQRGSLSVATLKRIYDSPIPKDMKEQVIFALGQRKDGIDELIELARHETNPSFRAKAIFWLGQSKDARAVKVLQEVLSQ